MFPIFPIKVIRGSETTLVAIYFCFYIILHPYWCSNELTETYDKSHMALFYWPLFIKKFGDEGQYFINVTLLQFLFSTLPLYVIQILLSNMLIYIMGELGIWAVFNIMTINEGDDFSIILGVFKYPTTNSSASATMFVRTSTTTTKISSSSSGLVNRFSGLAPSFYFWRVMSINFIAVDLNYPFYMLRSFPMQGFFSCGAKIGL